MPRYCPTCDGVFPVFYNIPRVPAGSLAVASGRRRRLLQSPESLAGMDDFHGTIDAMVSYTKSTGNEVLFSELFRSLIENAYATNTLKPGDSIDSFVDNVANGQVVLNSVAPTWNNGGTTYVVSEIFASKRVDGPIAIFDPNSPGAESANTTPPPTTTTPPPTTTPAPSNSTSRLTRADALEVKEIMTSPACQLRATKNSIDSFFFAIAFVMASMAI